MRILANLNVAGTLDIDTVTNAGADTDRFLVQDATGLVRYRTGAEVASDIGATVGFVSTVKHLVKLGENISKGQAVYISSADGTNMIVSKASNDSEAASSKVLGLLETGGVTNDQVYVITEGLLPGLNTSTATAGDEVWLGTNGNLIFGNANKPYAPANLVFLGVVTRVQQNNGEIFVKVQNGLELEELHNVQITTTPANNTVLSYETSTSLYKMKSIPTLLGFTPFANPMTTLGDVIYGGASGVATRLAGNTTTTKQYLSQTGTGSASAAPAWASFNTDARAAISLTTNGTSGVATYDNSTGVLNIPNYVGSTGIRLVYSFTATASQTTFTVTSYTPGLIDVFYNGSRLNESEYTATNGTTIVLNIACKVNDIVDIVVYQGNITGLSGVAGAGTANQITYWTGTNTIGALSTSTYPSLTELSYVKGVTSSIQTQLDAKQPLFGNQNVNLVYAGPTNGAAASPTFRSLVNADLPDSGVTAGTYNDSATQVKPFTVNAKGLITGVGTAVTITPAWSSITSKPTTISGFGITDAYTKTEVDSFLQGLDPKASVKAATTGTITLSGEQTIDDIALVAGDRVLVKDQSTQTANGIYVVSASGWSRSTDMDANSEFPGAYVFVERGTANADKGFVCTNDTVSLGSTNITFAQFSGTGAYQAVLNGTGFVRMTGTSVSYITGTSSQFVKADGTLDGTSYQTLLTNPITGDGTETEGNVAYFTGNTSISGESNLFWDASNNRLRINSSTWQATGAATKLQVGNVLSDGTSAVAQFNGFVRIRESVILHVDSDITKEVVALSAVDSNVVSVGGSVGAKLLVNTTTNNGENLYVSGNGQFTTTLGVGTGVSNATLSVKGNWVGGHSTIKVFPTTAFASGGLAGIGMFDNDGTTRKAYIAATNDYFQIFGVANVPTVIYSADALALTLSTSQNATFTGTITATINALATAASTYVVSDSGTLKTRTAAQVLSDIGAASTSSLSNYLPLTGGTLTNALTLNYATPTIFLNDSGDAGIEVGLRVNGDNFEIYEPEDTNKVWLQIVDDGDSFLYGHKIWTAGNDGTGSGLDADLLDGNHASAFQLALTNPITGDGTETAGNVAYFTGNTTIAGEDSFFYDAGNNRLRINSNAWGSNGETKLQVGDVLNSGSSAIAQLNGFVRIKDSLIIHQNADTTKQSIIQTVDNNITTINPNGGILLVNTDTSTAANYKFQVSGDMIIRGGGDIVITPATSGANATLYNDIGNLVINNTTCVNGSMRIGGTASPNNSSLHIVGDWVSGHSTLKIQPVNSEISGIGFYNIAGTRKLSFLYSTDQVYMETDNLPIYFNPNGVTRLEMQPNGTVGIGGGTVGVTQRDIHVVPTSASPAIYFGRLSSTNDDNTKIYFQNRGGTALMYLDTGNAKVGIGTITPTSVSGAGLEIYENVNGGSLSLSRDAGNQRGIIRFGRNNGGSFQNAAVISAGSDANSAANGNIYFETTNGSSALTYKMALLSSGRVVVGNSLTANGILQVTGEHIGGYGMINMNSTNSCILAMDSSGSYDVRIRYKYNGTDKWFAGMINSDNWVLETGGGTDTITANQSGDVWVADRFACGGTSNFSTGSAKLLVGTIISGSSSAIAQFNGFIRLKDQIIIHNNSNTALESSIICTASNELTAGGSFKASSFFETSDIRLKTNIQDYKSSDILNISAKIYEKDGKVEVGYLAQELEGILDSAISKKENGYLDLSYRQVHTAKIAALEEKIKQLEEQLKQK